MWNVKMIACFTVLGFVPFLQGCGVTTTGSGANSSVKVALDRRTAGTMIDDQTIELKALHALARHKELWKQSHISVLSYNNVILLVGQTPSEPLKNEATEAVQNIPKVRQVYNELNIEEPIPLSARSKDSWLTTQVKAKLIGNPSISAARIKVMTEDEVVYLMGLTSQEEQSIATEIARAIPGVKKVVQIFETAED